jgi:hypothetical protein
MKGNLKESLVKGLGKKNAIEFAQMANAHPQIYQEFIDIIESGESTPAMKASWILGTAARIDALPAQPHGPVLIRLLEQAAIGGVQRELLKVLEVVKMDADTEGKFIDYCFRLMRRPGIDVAIRYYCLRILNRAVKKYPDLKGELILTMEEIQDWHNDVWKRHISKAIKKMSLSVKKKN